MLACCVVTLSLCLLLLHAGVPQRELLAERAELLYGKAKFKPLKEMAAATVQ